MDMKFSIEYCSFWQETSKDQHQQDVLLDKKGWPKLDFLPAMQRRRLTPFMKMALHCAYDVCHQWQQQTEDKPSANQFLTVFSSRHGDLSQTSAMLEDLARRDPLSPTAFSLSVHNAVAGLYSILSKNHQASSTVSAGHGTFAAGLFESALRAIGSQQPVLFVHTEQTVPQLYSQFNDQPQCSHSVALIITANNQAQFQLSLTDVEPSDEVKQAPGATGFWQWWQDKSATELQLHGNKQTWCLAGLP